MDVKCLSLFLLMYQIYVLCAIEINRLNRLNRNRYPYIGVVLIMFHFTVNCEIK